MVMKAKILTVIGAALMAAGILVYWLTGNTRLEGETAEALTLGLLGLGALAVLIGGLVWCAKAPATKVLFVGAITAAFTIVIIPFGSRLTGWDINIHGWSGMLILPWFLFCGLGGIFAAVGFVRLIFSSLVSR